MTKLCVVAFVLTFAASCAAAQSVPPPPKPDTGPSLDVTMKYIRDKLTSMGRISTLISFSRDDMRAAYQIAKVETDIRTCTIAFEEQQTDAYGNGPEAQTLDAYRFSFRDVEKIEVIQAGGSNGTNQYIPPRYLLRVLGEKPTFDHTYQCRGRDCGDDSPKHNQIKGAVLTFDSEDTANRVAKAMLHAVEL